MQNDITPVCQCVYTMMKDNGNSIELLSPEEETITECLLEKTALKELESYHFLRNPLYMVIILLVWWIFLLVCVFYEMDFYSSPFFNIGPHHSLRFFVRTIDTWGEWFIVVVFIFVEQFVWTAVEEIIVPWKSNTIQDHKNIYIRRKWTYYYFIINTFEFIQIIRQCMLIQIFITQVDFTIVVVLADIMANNFTLTMYLREKLLLKVQHCC